MQDRTRKRLARERRSEKDHRHRISGRGLVHIMNAIARRAREKSPAEIMAHRVHEPSSGAAPGGGGAR